MPTRRSDGAPQEHFIRVGLAEKGWPPCQAPQQALRTGYQPRPFRVGEVNKLSLKILNTGLLWNIPRGGRIQRNGGEINREKNRNASQLVYRRRPNH